MTRAAILGGCSLRTGPEPKNPGCKVRFQPEKWSRIQGPGPKTTHTVEHQDRGRCKVGLGDFEDRLEADALVADVVETRNGLGRLVDRAQRHHIREREPDLHQSVPLVHRQVDSVSPSVGSGERERARNVWKKRERARGMFGKGMRGTEISSLFASDTLEKLEENEAVEG
eukprot:2127798-Rhodomonas_salina.1